MFGLGITYSLAAASLWPSVALLVRMEAVGSALGFMTVLQMAGNAVCNQVVGAVSEKWDYKEAVRFFIIAVGGGLFVVGAGC